MAAALLLAALAAWRPFPSPPTPRGGTPAAKLKQMPPSPPDPRPLAAVRAEDNAWRSGRRVGGRVEGAPQPRAAVPPATSPAVTAAVAVAALLLACRLLLGGADGGEYYVYSSSSSSLTVLDEEGRPRTETRTASSFRTNVRGLTSEDIVEPRWLAFP
ncbi:hypothetical protein AB1Y20_013857 [Prymnesium parvum]|uniref:Uncharacterized protein n=1 Tax=Prymnesium parvum TaxID=97485 RepID=A0AB34II22_PRYPA